MTLEKPGEYPYTRGINADAGVWTMGQYGGFGTPAETNARFKMLLDQGLTGFSVALDLPTQLGLDSDDPLPPVKAVLLDIMMPDIDGMEVLQRIRERWSSIQLPVIMAYGENRTGGCARHARSGSQ